MYAVVVKFQVYIIKHDNDHCKMSGLKIKLIDINKKKEVFLWYTNCTHL